MKTMAENILGAILNNTIWVFVTMILFISYIFLLDGSSAYLVNFLKISLFFSPPLLFALFRKRVQRNLPSWVFVLLWLTAFIVYPTLLILLGDNSWLAGMAFPELVLRLGHVRFFLVVGSFLLSAELALQFNDHLRQWVARVKWLKGLSLEKSILGICLLLSVFLAVIGIIELLRSATQEFSIRAYLFHFFSFTIQFFLIFLAYYFFYYINHYLLIPRLLKQKGVVYYGFSIAAAILFCYPVLIGLIRLLPVVYDLSIGIFTNNRNLLGEDGGSIPFSIMILSAPIIVSNQWFRQNREIALLEKEKTERELGLLKQQINPHFFFNTLNNLYALSLTKDHSTPQVILQLSELMRYVIYRGKEKEVSLQEEIQYIEDYINLQRLRLHQDLDYRFTKQIDHEDLSIPPLLFIILVENAFKHGIEPAERESLLHLDLKHDGDQLFFSCKNSKPEQADKKAGIGLQNLQRRLELLFPQRHELCIQNEQDTFTATLKLDLK
ncbi:MAG: histidine kinase [Saprospiraceae bacterium]|nr:histidine kinase [Lewinella sp.]